MTADSPGLLLTVIGLVLAAGLLTAVEAALAGFSRGDVFFFAGAQRLSVGPVSAVHLPNWFLSVTFGFSPPPSLAG